LEDLDTEVEINSAWETIRENRQIEVHKVEPLVSDLIRLEVKIAIQKLKTINRQVIITFWLN
jgi:hypothetical protein